MERLNPGLPEVARAEAVRKVLIVIELKNAADEEATLWTAFHQLQTYRKDIPSLFRFNELLVVSEGTHRAPARA